MSVVSSMNECSKAQPSESIRGSTNVADDVAHQLARQIEAGAFP